LPGERTIHFKAAFPKTEVLGKQPFDKFNFIEINNNKKNKKKLDKQPGWGMMIMEVQYVRERF
jgi:hypothetical protein